MSVNSPKQTYETFQEWFRWASNKYPSLRKKKKPQPDNYYREDL